MPGLASSARWLDKANMGVAMTEQTQPHQDFRELASGWAEAACQEWDYPEVDEAWHTAIEQRLPLGLRTLVAEGISQGAVQVDGHRFRPIGLPEAKGPYAFLSRSASERPAPNWEYFVQLAEFLRIQTSAGRRGLAVGFEESLMDITVRDSSTLLWAIEVKERASQLPALADQLYEHGRHVELDAPDRGNDALRKAKYLVTHRPQYFSLVAIGAGYDFSVAYTESGYALHEDFVPYA